MMITNLRTLCNLLFITRGPPTRLIIVFRLCSRLLTNVRVTGRVVNNTTILVNSNSLRITNNKVEVPINGSIRPYVRKERCYSAWYRRYNGKVTRGTFTIARGCLPCHTRPTPSQSLILNTPVRPWYDLFQPLIVCQVGHDYGTGGQPPDIQVTSTYSKR